MDWLHQATWPLFAKHGRLNPWPDHDTRLLLTVILSEPDAAILAWREWRRSNMLDQIAGESFQLLPQVYQRLRKLAQDDPDMGRLLGISRQVWVSNQRAFFVLQKSSTLLTDAGIPVLLLKGLPVLRYYGDMGARPAADADLLVPDDCATRACRILQEQGWIPARPTPSVELELMFGHAISFRHQDTALGEVDLHWRPFMLDATLRAEQALWARAQADMTVAGQRYLVPDSLDQLLLTLYNARKPDSRVTGRWITDAVMIAKALKETDWEALPTRAEETGLLRPVNECVDYLSSTGWLPIPPGLQGELAAWVKAEPLRSPWGLDASCRRGVEENSGFFESFTLADKCFWLLQWCRAVRRARGLRWLALFRALSRYLLRQRPESTDLAASATP